MRCTLAFAFAVLTSAPLSAAWFEDYDRGLRAVGARQWTEATEHFSRAIAQMPHENNRKRAYGTVFVAYHPYYYRGYSYLQLSRFGDAKQDFERAAGRGDLNLGEIDDLKLKASNGIIPPPPPTRDEVHPGQINEVTTRGEIAEVPPRSTTAAGRRAMPETPPKRDSFPRSYAVGWITLALINAGLAQSKRRSGLAWFLLSLVLGPVATFLIVFFGPAETVTG